MLDFITQKTGENPEILVIWLHGLGADGHDFEPVVPQFKNPDKAIQFIFPHAPIQPVTINGGMEMRSWYDIKMMDIGKMPDEAGIRESEQKVLALIEAQIKAGFKPEQIVLAGFSQGGAIALHTATRTQHKLAGVVALSCYLPITEKLADEESAVNKNTPFFIGHGNYDPVVPFQLGQSSFEALKTAGYAVSWHEYPLQHGVSMDELEDIKRFILSL
ncbi:dienelactone hydrolase family protein [Marinicella sp. S1101]|uniref:alpha/beta hydrolase n=1 Tax=Marinicella marina TaxID=2996016 RepID=UPI002260F3BD|nr:dienelactone hydrolase family protein [Marinicella marina]MCX7554371.1 dienelactone hydrolase family protein [Marinicella marina]MDJ1138638.1 dienelactone hydrolase family protein [Marinicella marina]